MGRLIAARTNQKSTALTIGRDQTTNKVEISPEHWRTHVMVTGSTGSGKTYGLLSLMIQQLRCRQGISVIDRHGDITAFLKKWVAANSRAIRPGKIHFVDLADPELTFSFNPLAVTHHGQLPAMADSVTNAIATIFDSGDPNKTPLIKSALLAIATVLGEQGLTLNEARYLLMYGEAEARGDLIGGINSPYYRALWNDWHQARRQDFTATVEAVERRLRGFFSHPLVQQIFGQTEKAIQLREVIDEGETVVLNLSTLGGEIPDETARIVGLLYINTLVRRARERDPLQTHQQHTLYIDECQNFITHDLARILDELRKYALTCVLSCQTMEQIRLIDERVYASVKSVARTKVAFAEESYEEALRLAKDIYASEIRPDRIKDCLSKPTVVGHRRVRLESGSTTTNQGQTKARGLSRSRSRSKSLASSRGQSSGEGSGTGEVVSSGTVDTTSLADSVYLPNADAMIGNVTPVGGLTQTTGSGTTTSAASAQSSSSNRFTSSSLSHSESVSEADALAEGESQAQSLSQGQTSGFAETLEPIFKTLPSATYSLDEQAHVFAVGLMQQPKRHATVKLPGQSPVQITTLELQVPVVGETKQQRTIDAMKAASSFLVPRSDALEAINFREATFSEDTAVEFVPAAEKAFFDIKEET
ncbi:MAG: DUF87 domain-containing protein [Pseudomonadota bacterium]